MIRMALVLVVICSCGGSGKSSKAMTAEENAALTAAVQEAHEESNGSGEDSDGAAGVCQGLDYFRGCVEVAGTGESPCIQGANAFLAGMLEGLDLPADTETEAAQELRGACNGFCEGKRSNPEASFEELCGALKEVAPDLYERLPRIN